MKEPNIKKGVWHDKIDFSFYRNCGETFILNAKYAGKSRWRFFIEHFLKCLSLTIPGFIIVLLFPIKECETYGLFSGIWHGWFALCNMVVHLFSPNTLYTAPIHTISYQILWWVSFVYSALLLFSQIIMPFLMVRDKSDTNLGMTENISGSNVDKHSIKVFISSTFHDMQEHRDYLITHTFPLLNYIALERGVKFIPIDLRWGITEEESKSGKVLDLCLRSIDDSIPFFIGLLGKRYGWRPTIEDFQRSQTLQKDYPWIENDFKQNKSITEIEMQYGVLRREEKINAIFFTTNVNCFSLAGLGNDEQSCVDALKREILIDGRYPLLEALSPKDMSYKIFSLFIDFLDQYFPATIASDIEVNLEGSENKRTKEAITNEYLNIFHKKLSHNHLKSILDSPLTNDTEILDTLLYELVQFGKYEELDQFINNFLEAKTPHEFYSKLLENYEIQYGQKQVRDFLSIMYLTNYGIKIEDALDMADVELILKPMELYYMYDWPTEFVKNIKHCKREPFDKYFHKYLKYEDGKISLVHEQMRQCVKMCYLANNEIIKDYRKRIVDKLGINISQFKESDKNIGRIEEYAYHLLKLEDKLTLEIFLGETIVKEYFEKYHKELYDYILQELSIQQ